MFVIAHERGAVRCSASCRPPCEVQEQHAGCSRNARPSEAHKCPAVVQGAVQKPQVVQTRLDARCVVSQQACDLRLHE